MLPSPPLGDESRLHKKPLVKGVSERFLRKQKAFRYPLQGVRVTVGERFNLGYAKRGGHYDTPPLVKGQRSRNLTNALVFDII